MPTIVRFATVAGWIFGAGCIALALIQLDVRPGEALRAALLVMACVLPVGFLLTRHIGWESWRLPLERLALAALIGTPACAAIVYGLALLDWSRLLPPVLLAFFVFALVALLRRSACRFERGGPAQAMLVAIFGLVALLGTRGYRAFESVPDGLLYCHGIEHAIHIAFSWELLRGIPPAELPVAAGLPFPHYHVLGYLPLVLHARYAGIGLITTYHALWPLWQLVLLCGAIHLAMKARTGRLSASLAAIVGLTLVMATLEAQAARWDFLGRAAFEFFLRSVSGGSGVLVWGAVAVLLAAHRRGKGVSAIMLAGGLAGLSYGFKAQMFLLLGIAFVVALGILYLRGERRAAFLALSACAAVFVALSMTWRTGGRLGRLVLAPGLFVRECGLMPLLDWLNPTGAWLMGTLLALVVILRFSPLIPVLTIMGLRRWRSAPALDLFVALLPCAALVLALGLAAEEIQPGEVSTLIIRESLYAVQIIAAAANVPLLGAMLSRVGWDGPRAVMSITLATALALAPTTALVTIHRGVPGCTMRLSPGEIGALDFLRRHAPLDAVVAQLRTRSLREFKRKTRALDRMPVVSAFAGRRTVLEYYRPLIDPEVDRDRLLRRLFRTRNTARGEAVLDRFRVDYVLEYAQRPLHFRSARLEPVYARDGVRLLRVAHHAPRPLMKPRFAPPGLR
jgi:hypothetical protein